MDTLLDALPDGVDPSTIPTGPPPPGVESNFIDPETAAPSVQKAAISTMAIMFVFGVLRAYARLRKGLWGVDDYIFTFAAVTSTVTCGFVVSSFSNELLGRHIWDVPLSGTTEENYKNFAIIVFLYFLSVAAMRIANLSLLLRVFSPSRKIKIIMWPPLVLVAAMYVFITIFTGFHLVPQPGSGGWFSPEWRARSSGPQSMATFTGGVIGVLVDFYGLIVPICFVYGLNSSMSRKLGLAAVFMAGFGVCALSIVATVYNGKSAFDPSLDSLYYGALYIRASVAEVNIGLACSCMPVIASLFSGWAACLTSTWASLSGKRTTNKPDKVVSDQSSPESGALPKVPKSRLRSLFNTGRHTEGELSRTERMSNYYELQTENSELDYHAYISGNTISKNESKGSAV